MKLSKFSSLVFFLFVAAVAALAADVNGKRVAQVPGRGGQTQDVTFNLKADGDS